jgi:hypothetical protein
MVLHGKLSLHDIRDVEQFTGRIIDRVRRDLTDQDNEDLWAYLIALTWELSLRYDRGDQPSCFSNYAAIVLKRRVVDWQRSRDGRTKWQFADRTHIRELPTFHPLEDRQDEPDPSQSMDNEVDRFSDLLGLQRKRSSRIPQRDNGMGKAPAREAA